MNLTQKNILTTAILLITCFFVYILIIHPTIQDIKTFNDRIQLERVSLDNKYTSRRNIKNIIADLKYVSDNSDSVFQKIIIPKDGQVEFISSLEAIAKKNNLVQKIQIAAAPASSNDKLAQKQNITISLSGDYLDVLKYLDEMDTSALYIIIQNISINSSKSQAAQTAAASGTVKVNLTGYVYFSS